MEQLKAQNAPPDLSGDELLQAALRAPVVARCRAKWKYDVVYDGELGFEEGDVIEVIEKVDDTWWHSCRCRATTGERARELGSSAHTPKTPTGRVACAISIPSVASVRID